MNAEASTAAVKLPEATALRWQPLRAGLLNLYLFEDEVLRFEQGRILLRGNNGTGKSRILALLLPFLFDGEIHPSRVEPDGDIAKRMEWHLLMNGRYPDRIGYAWLELGRRDEDGHADYRTIGIGMKAMQGRGAPTRWYFVSTQRVGSELALRTSAGVPLTRPRLEEAIAEHGEVFTKAIDYRHALDRAFFSLGPHRYKALIDLLIQLRKPQLSRQLDEARLSDALSEALPPLSDGVLSEIAEALRELENDRDELSAYREGQRVADRFLSHYQTYLRIATKQRSDAVRRRHADYERCMRELREAERAHEHAADEHTRLKAQIDQTELSVEEHIAEERALDQSEEMRSARALDQQRKLAAAAHDHHQRTQAERNSAVARADDARAQLQAAAEHFESARGNVTHDIDQCRARAPAAALKRAFEEAAARLEVPEPPAVELRQALRHTLDTHVRERLEQKRILQGHADKLAKHDTTVSQQRRDRDRCEVDLDGIREDRSEALAERGRLGADLTVAFRAWACAAQELTIVDIETVLDAFDEWIQAGDGDSPVSQAIVQVHERAVARLAELHAAGAIRLGEAELAVKQLIEERQRVAEARQLPPPLAHTRDQNGRADRAGAPLWALCDFREEVSGDARAGYEAALEAAGLLDAWVSPDGHVQGLHDATLLAGEGASCANSLADVMQPSIDASDSAARTVPEQVVRQLLSTIAIEPEGEVWALANGSYRLGPLHGDWSKAASQHIGHAARQQERRRRLAELDAAIAEARGAEARARQRLTDVQAQQRRAAAERSAAPSDEALRQSINRLEVIHEQVQKVEQRFREAERLLQQAQAEQQQAANRLAELADELGLSPWLNDLAGLERAIAAFREATAALWPRLQLWQQAGETRAAREQALRAHQLEVAERQQAERDAQSQAAAAARHHQVLEETVGAKAHAIMARLQDNRARQQLLKQHLRSARSAAEAAFADANQAIGRIETLKMTLETYSAERHVAVEDLRALAQRGLLAEAEPELANVSSEQAWSASYAVDLARQIEQLLERVDAGQTAWDRSKDELFRRMTELNGALLPRGYTPSLGEYRGVTTVTVSFQGGDKTIGDLARMFADEIKQRERFLDAKERDVIENHLIDEISAQLHEHLRHGENLVRDMNAEIESRPMSTGMQLRFGWEPIVDGPQGLVEVRRKLLFARAAWSPPDRLAIAEFLKRRLDDVRQTDSALTWRDQLAQAFDYRKWHRFVIERDQGSGWQRLTRRSHGTGSGGEKAVALTVPQLAAAAAHYSSAAAHAPRLILLDEAFVGVDSDMRGKCMEMLVAFDLDFMMTSEREWGCYAGLPGLAIYQLTARPGIDAIHTTRWVWNGRERAIDDSPAGGSC